MLYTAPDGTVGYRVNSYQATQERLDREYISDFDREIKRMEGLT